MNADTYRGAPYIVGGQLQNRYESNQIEGPVEDTLERRTDVPCDGRV
jgi:hypothetical protein